MSLFLASPRNQGRTKKKAITSGGPAISGTCDQWDLLPNQYQKMHGEQEETEQSRKVHEREYPLSIEECAEQ